jgi:hypothetical protein
MKKNIHISITALGLALMTFTGCVKDYADPSRATEDKIGESTQGLTGVAVSLQSRYAAGRGNIYNTITISGFLTNEITLLNQGNTGEFQLSVGGNTLDGGNTVITNLWSNSTKIMFDADYVISRTNNVPDKGFASGLLGYATIFKSLALGDLAAFWERVPASTGQNATFITRNEAYVKIIADIDRALAAITTNPISSSFTSTIPQGIDIPNTLRALKARYALYAGNNSLALSSANAVDLSKKSVFLSTSINQNGIFGAITSSNNVWQPIDDTFGLPVGLQPASADKRISFYLSINNTIAPKWRMAGFAASLTSEWPVYLPSEMTLIKAEALARPTTATQADLDNALIELNKIQTKKASQDPLGVGADLPALASMTKDQIMTEIFRQRSIEMYISGQKLEDSRRFGRPQAERKRNFVNYPFRERDQNPNTPTDPAL